MAGTSPDRLSRGIEAALRLGGLALALMQGVYLVATGDSASISPPILGLAALMMGLARGVRRDRERANEDDAS